MAVAAMLGSGSVQSSAAQGDATAVIDFDDVPANRSGSPAAPAITDRYAEAGLVFITPVIPLVYDAASFPPLDDFARSGTTVVTTCYAAEFCSNEIVLRLDSPHARLGLWVGYAGPLEAPAELLVEGFDDDRLVAVESVDLGPSDEPIPVDTPVALLDELGRLTRVEVRWAEADRFLSELAIDDVELTPFVARTELRASPAQVRLDAGQGSVSEWVRFENTGNVEVAVRDAVLQPSDGDSAVADLQIAESDCAGVLPPGGGCEVLVRYTATVDGGDVVAHLTLLRRDGSPLIRVPTMGIAPPAQREVPTPGGDVGGATADESPWPTAVGALLAGLLLLAGLSVGIRRLRRQRERLEPAPRVACRLRHDPGRQTIEPAAGPVVALLARTHTSQDQTHIEGGDVDGGADS